MMQNDQDSFSAPKDCVVSRHRGRELAKLLGAVGVAVAGLAAACHGLWDLRDDWSSWTIRSTETEWKVVATSDDPPLVRGRRIYQARCVSCHGPQGHGDGPAMVNSQSRPRDLASASWRSGAVRGEVRRVIADGTLDKSMPGSAGAIPDRELDSVVDYVLSLEILDLLNRAGLSPGTGASAPPFWYRDAEGTAGCLDQHRGKVVLVAFWGTTCAPCLDELSELESLVVRYAKTDLVVLPICLDSPNAQQARDVAAKHAPRLRVYVDPDDSVGRRYDVQHLPQSALVDRDGRLLGRALGVNRWARKDLERLLSAGLGLLPSRTQEEDAGL
jgi:peroxiredoxin